MRCEVREKKRTYQIEWPGSELEVLLEHALELLAGDGVLALGDGGGDAGACEK